MIYHVFTSTHRRYTKCAGWMTRVRIKLFRFPLIVCVCGEQRDDVVVDDEEDNKSAVRSTKCTENLLSCVSPTVISSPMSFTFLMPSCILADAFHYGDDGQAVSIPTTTTSLLLERKGNYWISFALTSCHTRNAARFSQYENSPFLSAIIVIT